MALAHRAAVAVDLHRSHLVPEFGRPTRPPSRTTLGAGCDNHVTLSTTGLPTKSLGPAKPYDPGVYAALGTKGSSGTITVRGSSTGSSFTVRAALPKSCAGLPTIKPVAPTWGASGPPVVTDGPAATSGNDTTLILAGAGLVVVGVASAGTGLRMQMKRRR
ncbi:hypothetical protein [Rudaeicoccus suwonensis]|uniref:hypothetical protein n=1 Tax=Rudaeicoccus suwonensis TaxID=657409 RepID=UPI001476E4F2|nr:hypothetical protein [Rudaeicoccus suwonensis]